MKVQAVKDSNANHPSKFVLLLIIAAVPLAVTTITHNQSDIPKNVVLIISASLFFILAAYGFFMDFISKSPKSEAQKLSFVPQLDIPFVLLLLAAVLSTLFSINRYISYYGQYERQIGLITFIYFFFIYFFSVFIFDKENLSGKIVLTMELTAAAVSVYAILQQVGIDPFGIQPAGDTRPVTTIGNAVFAGGFLAIVLPLSAFNISEKKNIALKFIIPAVILAGIVVTRTRSAYLAVIAEMIVAAVILFLAFRNENEEKRNNKKIIYFAAAGIAVIVIIFILVFSENIFTQRLMSIFKGGDNPRWMIWRDAFGIFGKYPLTGPGIGMFPNAFTEFYSYELRHQDVMRYVDNAHNNYLQVLFTMGVIGLGCYLIILVSAFRACLKNLVIPATEKDVNRKLYFAAIFTSLAGYSIYGLTNFDELTIMLYFTMLLALLRSRMPHKKSIAFKRSALNKFIMGSSALAVSVFVIFTSVNVTKILYADIHFLKGEKLIMGNQFKSGVNEMNNAIILHPENSVYRQLLAENVYGFVNLNRSVKESVKTDLLKEAAEELVIARKNHSNVNDCDALLSLVYYESGRTKEAEELKNKVLMADGVNVMYRLNLAYFFIGKNELGSAKEQLEAVDKINFLGMNRWYVEAKYHLAAGNKNDALTACSKILVKEPNNKEVLDLQKKANMLP